jgi:hypothetical protein
MLLVALWVDPEAFDETAVRLSNREAMHGAIANALAPDAVAAARALADRREDAANAFYTGE